MKCRRHARSSRRGLTILEVVLAMAILALGMGAVMAIFTSAAGLGVTAGQRARSAAALEYVVSELTERLFPLNEDGSVGEPPLVTREPIPGHAPMTYSASAAPLQGITVPGVEPLYRVDVAIHWSEQGRERTLEHRMLLPRSVAMGDRLRRELFDVAPLAPSAPPAESATPNTPGTPGSQQRQP